MAPKDAHRVCAAFKISE